MIGRKTMFEREIESQARQRADTESRLQAARRLYTEVSDLESRSIRQEQELRRGEAASRETTRRKVGSSSTLSRWT